MDQKPGEFLHHNSIFDVATEKSDYGAQNSVMMQKACGVLAH